MLLAPGGMVLPLSKCWRRSNLKNGVEVGRMVGPVVLGNEQALRAVLAAAKTLTVHHVTLLRVS